MCDLLNMRDNNKYLYDAYAYLGKFEPFKEKYKDYRKNK